MTKDIFIFIFVDCVPFFGKYYPFIDLSFNAYSFRVSLSFSERLIQAWIVQMGESILHIMSKLNNTLSQIFVSVGNDPIFTVFQPGQQAVLIR